MSLLGIAGKFVSVSVGVPAGVSVSNIYTNNTLLTTGKTYLVTAEFAFRRIGSAWDAASVSFAYEYTSSNVVYYDMIGLPFTWHFFDNDTYLHNISGTILGAPHSSRQSAQALINNGKIILRCSQNTDDTMTYQIYITAIEI
jgi:hypothetical protein